MPEEVLFESESDRTRDDVATYLRTVADRLERGDDLTMRSGGDSITLQIPDRLTFEVKAEREGPADAAGERSVEFELEWDEIHEGSATGGPSLEIE
ncbi:MAG: amphi-Trp domain-containing protein [Halanaeroarchaeum sp.]